MIRPVGDGPQGQRPQIDRHVADRPADGASQPGSSIWRSAYQPPINSRTTANTPTAATVQPSHQIVRRRFPDRATAPIAARHGDAQGDQGDRRDGVLEVPEPEVAELLGDVAEAGREAALAQLLRRVGARQLKGAGDHRHRLGQVEPGSARCRRSGGRRGAILMAPRKMARNVSVLRAESMPVSNAGRKAIACWLPLRTSCSVRRVATSWRTSPERSTDVDAGRRTPRCRRACSRPTGRCRRRTARCPRTTRSTGTSARRSSRRLTRDLIRATGMPSPRAAAAAGGRRRSPSADRCSRHAPSGGAAAG